MMKAASLNKLKLVRQKAVFFQRMVVYREAKLFSNIISLSIFWEKRLSKSVSVFLTISFIPYPLIISRANANLNKVELQILNNFKFKFQYILFYTLLAIFF